MATTVNHDMDQGTNFAFTIRAKDGSGFPIDLTSGYTAHAQMRRFYSSSTAIDFDVSITGGTGTQIGGSSTVSVDQIQPVGTIIPFVGNGIPDTWL